MGSNVPTTLPLPVEGLLSVVKVLTKVRGSPNVSVIALPDMVGDSAGRQGDGIGGAVAQSANVKDHGAAVRRHGDAVSVPQTLASEQHGVRLPLFGTVLTINRLIERNGHGNIVTYVSGTAGWINRSHLEGRGIRGAAVHGEIHQLGIAAAIDIAHHVCRPVATTDIDRRSGRIRGDRSDSDLVANRPHRLQPKDSYCSNYP